MAMKKTATPRTGMMKKTATPITEKEMKRTATPRVEQARAISNPRKRATGTLKKTGSVAGRKRYR